MDDLRVIQELRPDVPLPGEHELAPARNKLALAMRPPTKLRRRRVALRGLAAGGIAAGIAAVLIIGQSAGDPPAADAAAILHQAAQTARQQPDVVPGPNQFVYQRGAVRGDSFAEFTYERWDSVNGMRDSLFRTAAGDTVKPSCESAPPDKGEGCTAQSSVYDPTLPTDADSMLKYLREHDFDKYDPTTDAANKAVGLTGTYLRPNVAAALFEAVAKIPGIEVVPNAVDAAGRSGVGVAWEYGKTRRDVLILDPQTYAYLGHNITDGQHHFGEALITMAIVNERGQLP